MLFLWDHSRQFWCTISGFLGHGGVLCSLHRRVTDLWGQRVLGVFAQKDKLCLCCVGDRVAEYCRVAFLHMVSLPRQVVSLTLVVGGGTLRKGFPPVAYHPRSVSNLCEDCTGGTARLTRYGRSTWRR